MATRRTRKPVQLGLDPSKYNPYGLRHYSEAELRQEYSRLRSEAQDRLRGFARSSEFRGSAVYQENKNAFPTLKEIGSTAELRHHLSDVARFVTAKGSSVSGQREIRRQSIDTLHEKGYTWINTKNYDDFARFMQWAREHKAAGRYGSEQAVKAFRDAVVKKRISSAKLRDEYNSWAGK